MAIANKDIDKAFEILTTMSMDKNERAAYLSREMALHDQATFIEEGREEGWEEGREEGRREEKIEIAKKLLDILDDETIALKTGLDINEVGRMRK